MTGETVSQMVARWLGENPAAEELTLTRAQLIELVRREIDYPYGECEACSYPLRADHSCSRHHCCNSD